VTCELNPQSFRAQREIFFVNFAFFAANSLTSSSRRRRRTEDRSQHAAHDLAPQLATDRAHRAFAERFDHFTGLPIVSAGVQQTPVGGPVMR
jgi:hypothetical protein